MASVTQGACVQTQLRSWFDRTVSQKNLSAGRRVGMESEHPVVFADGRAVTNYSWLYGLDEQGWNVTEEAGTGDEAIPTFEKHGNAVTLDAGRATVEVVMRPHTDLEKLDCEYRSIMRDLVAIVQSSDPPKYILGYGCQPCRRRDENIWTPRLRYGVLQDVFCSSVLWKITQTSCLQCHVEYASEREAIDLLNVFNMASGPLIAIMGNSPVFQGNETCLQATREDVWNVLFPEDRVGVYPHRGDWLSTYDQWIDTLMELPIVCTKQEDGTYRSVNMPFHCWARENVVTDDVLTLHEGMFWPVARIRSDKGTIEVRPPCQQLPEEQMTLPAFCLGIAANLSQATELLREVTPKDAARMRRDAIRKGLRADGVSNLFEKLYRIAVVGLRSAGYDDSLLNPVRQRYALSRVPADEVRDVFHQGGSRQLVQKTSFS